MKSFVASTEQLVHFRCQWCEKWWSIGDAPEKEFWYCPWCGACLAAPSVSASLKTRMMSRDLIEYPVTTADIVDLLEGYIRDESVEPTGEITVPTLEEAVRRIRTAQTFCVARDDDNGQHFVVREGLSEKDAGALRTLLEHRGHKQVYSDREDARPKKRLEESLSQFKPNHQHEETDWGEQKGEEAW